MFDAIEKYLIASINFVFSSANKPRKFKISGFCVLELIRLNISCDFSKSFSSNFICPSSNKTLSSSELQASK